MTRHILLPLALAATLSTLPAHAQGLAASANASANASLSAEAALDPRALAIAAKGEAEIIATLQAQGFTVVETGRTLLGRIRITAESAIGTREVILHQRTGEVLRDVIFKSAASATAAANAGVDSTLDLGATVQGTVNGAAGAAGNLVDGVTGTVGGAVGGITKGLSGGASGSLGGSLGGGLTGGLGL